jgi:hypothetical protein
MPQNGSRRLLRSQDELDVKFKFSDLSIALEALAKVKVATLMNMRLEQMSQPSCLMSTLDDISLEEMAIAMGDAEIGEDWTNMKKTALRSVPKSKGPNHHVTDNPRGLNAQPPPSRLASLIRRYWHHHSHFHHEVAVWRNQDLRTLE